MNERKKYARISALILFITLLESAQSAETIVSCIEPHYGSINGQTRLTISGTNFARSQFNFGAGNEHVGNKINMVSKTRSVPCKVHPDGTTETQLMCYTEKMPEDDYYVRVTVDGVDVTEGNHCAGNSDCCKFTPKEKYTPTIEGIEPRSGRPGTLVKIRGKLVTDRYGSNLAASSNGRLEKLLRVYLGSQNCELKDLEADTLLGLTLDNEGTSWNGELVCKEQGTFIGHLNASFIVEGSFGRSRPNPAVYLIGGSDKPHMFQTHTWISSISVNEGSKMGGVKLVVYGKHFDETTAPVKIRIGSTMCHVIRPIQDDRIVCQVEPEPTASPAAYSGARGLVHHIWNETTKSSSNIDDIMSLSTSAIDYSFMNIDEMAFSHTSDKSNYVDKMVGFFVPPRDDEYQFYIKADDQAKLYLSTDQNPANKVKIAESSFNKDYFSLASQESSRIALVKGRNYYIEAIHRQGSGSSNLKVAARIYHPKIGPIFGFRWQEEQTISLNSVVVKDVITLTVTPPSGPKTAVSEVQTVTITALAECTFRLGLYSAYTELLKISSSAEDVKKAIEALPGVQPDLVTATVTPSSDGAVFVVTFKSNKGDLPEMMSMISAEFENTTTITVAETTKGQPSLEGYQLMMTGIPSPLISPTATANELQGALLEMFSVQCPPSLGKPQGTTFFENYESTVSGNFGTPVSFPEPFCGRRSALNPWYIFHKGGSDSDTMGKSLSQYKALCLAYKGKLNKITVRYSYADGANVVRRTATSWSITAETPTKWVFSCWDMLEKVKAHRADGTDYRVDWITVSRSSSDEDLFVDSVGIARAFLSTDEGASKQRMPPAKPNGAMIRDVTVTSSAAGTYTVNLDPYDCGNNFPLFQVAHGELKTGSVDSSSSAAESTLTYGGSNIRVAVSRTSQASVPITGSLQVLFKGQTSEGISPSATAKEVAEELQALSEFGNVAVEKVGDCANMDFKIKWVTKSGDQPEVTLKTDSLSGNTVTTRVRTNMNGSLWYDPIPGDMLKTMHSTPQVSLDINNVPSACDGDCSFQWTTSATPTIVSVTPTSGTEAQGTSITITGTGFDATPTNNTIMIGGIPCNATAATTTSLTCTVGNGPTGEHDIKLIVMGKGKASGTVTFEYVSAVQSIIPTTGSIGGGTTLTITGYGFMLNATVTVGGNDCGIISAAPGQLVCLTPQSASTSGGATDVIVNQSPGSPLTSPTQFTYDASSSSTPVITAISTTTSRIEGGETITIDGTGFGSAATSSDALKIGTSSATISSYSNTQVVALLPSNPPGSYPVQLQIGTKGFADLRTNSIASIVYTLQVTNIFPSKGSLYGGTRVTVTGTGFTSDKSILDVKFGKHICSVENVTANEIVCTIEDTAVIHDVRNTGTHPDYGYGYAWNPSHASVNVGDKVKFQWTTPQWITSVKVNIVQTVNASSTMPADAGFTSGPKTANGVFEHRFTKTGTYYYWSGFVDEYDIISYRGTITVTDRPSHSQQLVLKIAGHEAIYQTGGADPSSSGSCPGTAAAITGCSDAEPSISDSSKFNFKFWSCLSPTVSNMDLTSGTSNDLITATGSGFGSNNCENEVMIGDGRGLVESASDSSFSFKIDPSTSPVIGTKQRLTLRVGNRGFALVDLANSTFALLPGVSSISPSSGSTAGGTILTLTGYGFQGTTSDVSVTIDVYPCQIQSLTYTQIVCSTPPLSAGQVKVSVIISAGGQQFTAECASCSYTYDAAASPTVSAVSPTTVSGSTTSLNVTGTLFGTSTGNARVVIGGEECVVSTVTTTQIDCTIGGVKTGTHPLEVYVAGKGRAVTSVTIDSPATISSLDPVQGSINGGLLLKINGNGFSPINTTVSIDGSDCPVINATFTLVVCRTPVHAAGSTNVIVTSETVSYTSQSFTYASSASPVVTSINPTQGTATNTLTITGTGFSSTMEDNSVTINNVPCVLTSASTTSIACTLGDVSSGAYPVVVNVAGFGFSDSNTQFTYEMTLSTISPSTGSSSGGQSVTLSGSGFVRESMTVTVCGQPCSLKSNAQQTSTSYVCLTPPATGTVTTTTQCDVVATVNTITQTLTSGYTYDANLTPTITGVSPPRGGTAGGTTLTITGTRFGSTVEGVSVTIDNAVCNITTVSPTQIVCVTGPSKPSDTKVTVEIQGNGIAKQTSANFYYIDVWSSRYTWGNQDPPTEGDLVIIPRNQTLLLDTDTAILKMLVIQGGKLIFDEKDVELKAENILIIDGGVLQVGTEAEPFQHKGVITMFGNLRSPELPIYGAKCLAVRDGTLDLHGKPTHVTWSRLASTASAGATTITLEHPVEWEVGDQIVIATTSHRHSQKENEVRTIASISNDKLSLTLTEALTYTHIGISETFDGQTVEFRAEVGLLTHNVVVRGSRNMQWNDKIEACPEGFDTGEFSTQTCFQGRFGEEMGSDQFGAQIMLHAPRKDENLAVGRISYIEVTYAGQAFRLGRYPIHWHLNGDMSASYVRGCAIHETFNRAVNVHFTHNLLVEHNVIYNVMGGAFFLEDGIETGNIFQYNLGIFVRASSSLLNDDITPATFWVTNPNNTIRHNAAAGGSHFGFWYRMHQHPEGPSKTDTVCPKHVPLGQFINNTAHSFGWFGLWIFEDYFPKVGGSCSKSAASEVAVFEFLTAWNCEKGAEAVNSGALQFKDFILVNNEKAGYEGKLLSAGIPQYAEDGPMVRGGLIVGHSSNLDTEVSNGCTHGGVILPYQNGFMVKGTKFVNFDRSSCAAFRFTRIAGTCTERCGGFVTKTTGLGFSNSNRKVHFDWQHEGVIVDIDGSLTGSAGNSAVPSMGILPPAKCSSAAPFSVGTVPGSTCQADVKFHRFAFNNIKPSSLESKDVVLENQFGNVSGPYRFKRITHKPGWVVIMVDGESYKMSFENGEHVTNISYTGVFYNFESGQAMTLEQKTEKKPDRVMIDGSTPRTEQTSDLDTSTMENGDWRYNYTTGTLSYIVSASQSRKKRGVIVYDTDRAYDFKAYRCYYTDCIPPPDPTTVLTRPNTSMLWSDANTWLEMNITKPVDGDDLTIGRDFWIILDEAPPRLRNLIIDGGLEFEDDPANSFTLNVDFIIIKGRLVIGWEQDPFDGNAEIILHGEHSTPKYPVNDGAELGSKFIGVYGGLDLHGKDYGVQWTKLGQSATAGSNQITLKQAVNWTIGDEIVIAPTSLNVWHTETFTISAISGDKMTLTLNSSLAYNHVYYTETLATGQTYTLAAEVGHLTRNIKIKGNEYPKLMKESFGARILVGRTADATKSYVGFARISNVEFYHTGQEGWTEPYDPRFSLSYVDVPINSDLPSFVKKSAFHNGFSPAIGVFGVNDIVIADNVIHRTVDSSIVTNSARTKLYRNLMLLNLWSGSYLDRFEDQNIRYQGCVEAIEATELIMNGNVAAGSERAGFHVRGEPCSGSGVEPWMGNEAHTALSGVAIFPAEKASDATCVQFSNFFVWKNGDFGIYYNNPPSVKISNIIAADNQLGIFPMVVGPSATGHQLSDKTVEVNNSVIIGHTPSFDCTIDKLDGSDANIQLSSQGRSWGNGTRGVVGVAFPSFTQGPNNAPEKPFTGVMAYNSISGLMKLNNITFARFGQYCASDYDFAITTSPKNDDGQHPMETQNIAFTSVGLDNKIFYHVPNVGKINPSDCVDMDCDGLKKNLIKDLDGSLLGSTKGSVIPLSEFEWDGDARRGLGDYRIPKVMLTDLQGNRLDVSTLAPNKGVVRNTDCVYHDNWRAYECHDIDYEMLIIESMDADTETRRVSPVAVLSEGYLDLINGPQDHGWCSGYTCRKRLSTFMSLVAIGKNHDIFFTGTTPQHLRFILLNSDSSEAVRIGVWFASPNRLDVYVDGKYIMPKNGVMKNGRFTLIPPKTSVEYMPDVNETSGTNYVSREEKMIFVIVKGDVPVEIRTAAVIIVNFNLPAMTVDDFFGENLIQNLASFLGVDPRKVRIANVVSEASRKRRKRTVQTTTVVVEIGDEPGGSDPSPLSYSELTTATETITNQAQLGSFDDIVNATVLGISTIEPTPPPTDPAWSNVTNDNPVITLTSPSLLEFYETVVAGKEQNVFTTAPKIRVKDTNGNYMTTLGASSSPWQITATLFNGTDSRATLIGTTTVTFSNGWANFTDLAISHMGTGYVVEFRVTSPSAAGNFSISTDALTITARSVTANLVSISTSLLENELFELVIDLRDADTGSVITDIAWRNHSWFVQASLMNPTLYYGSLQGTQNLTFDPSNGRVFFNDFNLTAIGTYFLDFHIYTDPAGYDFHYEKEVRITSAAQSSIVVARTNVIDVKVDAVFDANSKYIGVMIMNYYSNMFKDLSMRITGYTVRPGSVIVSMTVEGSLADVNSTVYSLCSTVENTTSFNYGNQTLNLLPYMMMDGQSFYGVSCGPIIKGKDDKSLHPGIIAALAIMAILLVGIIVGLIVWKCCYYPKTKTGDCGIHNKYLGFPHNRTPENTFYSENSFTGLCKNSGNSTPAGLPPLDTLYNLPIDRHGSKLKFKS